MTPKELHEARKAFAATLTQGNVAGFVDTTILTRWANGAEQVTGKRWVSYLTTRSVRDEIQATGTRDLAKIVPCTHLHSTKTSATQCATKRSRALPTEVGSS